MKLVSVMLAPLAVAFGLALAGCGGSASVPPGAIALVGGTEIPRSALDTLVAQQKKTYESRKQAFPKVGTANYQSLQTQLVAYLVQVAELEQAANAMGVHVTAKDVQREFDSFLKTSYHGSRAKLQQALKQQGWTEQSFRKTLRVQALSKKVFDEVTKDAKVTSSDLQAYCAQSQSACTETRDVRHILIAVKNKSGKIDDRKSKAEANRIYAQLKAGANFAALAKKYSADTASKAQGGKLTISRGQTVPTFDAAAFGLKTGEISHPVRSQYGYHVIQALSDVKKPDLKPIRASLLQQKQNQVMAQWVQDLQNRYKNKVKYAAGFQPPAVPTTSTTTQ
jgi:parvulin-like peptidyl-prolyl isomerase